jgi:hypothetical protein
VKISRVPEPALIRSALVTITGIVALVIGHNVDIGWIDVVVNVYTALSALIAGILIRPAVTPVAKLAGSDGE